jgi:hypothetical protein
MLLTQLKYGGERERVIKCIFYHPNFESKEKERGREKVGDEVGGREKVREDYGKSGC